MDFSQYLNDYLAVKRLQGMSPTQRTAVSIFSPYFKGQQANEAAGRKLETAEKGLAWQKEEALSRMALERTLQQQMMESAGRNDTRATIGNVIAGVGSVAQIPLLKRYGYLR